MPRLMRHSLPLPLIVLGVLSAAANGDERPYLHPLFTDHMVLQRGIETPVWGWTQPGAVVTVSLQGKTAQGTAGEDGRWLAKLPPLFAGGPFEMHVLGPQRAVVKDVLVGEVWICSGQSNMEWSVANSSNAEKEVAEAKHPRLRLFTVPKTIALEPQSLVQSSWQVCSPETIPGFSAVGYFFGRELQQRIDFPVGLIHTSWGGTVAEAWTSAEALAALDDFKEPVETLRQQAAAAKGGGDNYDQQLAHWWQANDPGSKAGANWQARDFAAEDWGVMNLPGAWENAGLPNFDGIVWFRRAVEVPAELAGKTAQLELGPIDDVDDTWLNGERVGGMPVWTAVRSYPIAAGKLQAGANVVAVRVLDTGGGGGLYGQPEQMRLVIPKQEGVEADVVIPLNGEWKYRASAPLGELQPMPQRIGSNPNVVTVLYNGMIAPLVPYGVRGAIWYQGESNAGRAMQYRKLLPALIQDWRARFAAPELSFHIVQLANFMEAQSTPVQSGWAELREAQLLTAQADPKVGLAVTTDIGDAADIHPRDKQNVGRRLALQALAATYGRTDVVSAGPTFTGMTIDGDKATLQFSHVGGGLQAKGGGELKGFAIAGADGSFVWAKAEIVDGTVVVSSPEVSAPAAVRYNWANNPIGNLINKEGLPAGPFRTDVPPTP